MRESTIEARLRKKVKEAGGVCWKWVSPGRRGVPDRIVIFPHGAVAFVELKAPGKTERPDQVLVQGILRRLGCEVFSAVDSYEKVGQVVERMTMLSAMNIRRGDADGNTM